MNTRENVRVPWPVVYVSPLEYQAAEWVKPHSYMNEPYATMDCHHPRLFRLNLGLSVLLVCCQCGRAQASAYFPPSKQALEDLLEVFHA